MHSPRVLALVLLMLGVLAFSPLTAFAQAEAQADQPPTSASPVGHHRPGAYRHDGFYLRMGTGLAYGWIKGSGTIMLTSYDPGSDTTLTYKGWGPAYELLIGGTVARGFVLGGGVVGQRIWNPEVTKKYILRVRSDSTFDDLGEGAISIGLIGAFVDWFPQEGGGLHLGIMVGLALLGLEQGNTGVAGALWSGYDFWISSEWSLGIQARLTALHSKHSLNGYSGTLDDSAINAALLFAALYN